MSTIKCGPQISTNGLIFHVDASHLKSYPGSGADLFDLSTNNYDGSLEGAIYTSQNGGAIECIDASSNGSLINFGSINFNITSMSIEYWFKLTSNPNVTAENEYRYMAFKSGNFFNFMEQSRVINFTVHKGGTQFRRFGSGDGVFAHGYDVAGNAFVIGEWYQCVFTYNENNGWGSYYCNGSLVREGLMRIQNSPFTAITPGPMTSSSSTFIFSTNDNVSPNIARFFPGYLASMKIYNRPIQLMDVQQNYNVLKKRFGL